MGPAHTFAVALTATATLALAGCGGDRQPAAPSPTSSSPTSPSPGPAASNPAPPNAVAPALGQPGDYTALLISAADIGPDFTAYGAPTQNPNGVPGVGLSFNTADTSRVIVDGVTVFADPAAAAQAIAGHPFPSVDQPAPQPFPVGQQGKIATGTSPDKQNAVTEVLFAEGRATVNLIFKTAAGSPTPPDFVLDIARKQDAAVKNGLPS